MGKYDFDFKKRYNVYLEKCRAKSIPEKGIQQLDVSDIEKMHTNAYKGAYKGGVAYNLDVCFDITNMKFVIKLAGVEKEGIYGVRLDIAQNKVYFNTNRSLLNEVILELIQGKCRETEITYKGTNYKYSHLWCNRRLNIYFGRAFDTNTNQEYYYSSVDGKEYNEVYAELLINIRSKSSLID